jgi:Cof subfamily protein (haloacid dehalogenase superfamily)
VAEPLISSRADHPTNTNNWRLVVSDLDGTLLDERGQIPPANLEAVDRLRRLGIGFTVASGRHFRMAAHVARLLQIDLPIIACNGALIGDCRTGRVIRQECLPAEASLAMTQALLVRDIDFVCYTRNHVYYWRDSGRSDIVRNFNALAGLAADRTIPMIRLGDPATCPERPEWVKIVLSVPDAATSAQVAALLAAQPQLGSVMSQDGVLELNAAGTSKGAALRHLAGLLGIRPDEIIAFGDHDNDVTLLAAAGLGIAVANATPAAFAASQMQTAAHHEAGVAAALRRLFD